MGPIVNCAMPFFNQKPNSNRELIIVTIMVLTPNALYPYQDNALGCFQKCYMFSYSSFYHILLEEKEKKK